MRFCSLLLAFLLSTVCFAGSFYFSVSNQAVVSVTGTSTQFLPFNARRAYLLIQNNGSDYVILKIATVQSGTEGIIIAAGGNYEPIKAPQEAIFMMSNSGTQSVLVVEGQ